MKESFISQGNCHILYDGDEAFDPSWFSRDTLEQKAMLSGEAPAGRASALFFQADGTEYLLKAYHRGGLCGKFVKQSYLYAGTARTRAFAEWRALAYLRGKGLPAPRPLAAACYRRGAFYSAHLITQSCRPAMPLSQYLAGNPVSDDGWAELGKVLHHLHLAGVLHPDLNAHNILYDKKKKRFWLIDFDRSKIKSVDLTYYAQHVNLARLRRSLEKLAAQAPSFHYTASCFDRLSEGYASITDEADTLLLA